MKRKENEIFEEYKRQLSFSQNDLRIAEANFLLQKKEIQKLIRKGELLQQLRDDIVPVGSGFDHLLAFFGIRRKYYHTQGKETPSYKGGLFSSLLYKTKVSLEMIIDSLLGVAGNPSTRQAIWTLVKPFVISTALRLSRSFAKKSISFLLSIPFKLFQRKKKKGQ